MMYTIEFSRGIEKIISKWRKSNPKLFKKLLAILDELVDHPREGTGHPEPLKNGNGITYSRRITASDRIVYNILDDKVVVVVIKLEGHYNDK